MKNRVTPLVLWALLVAPHAAAVENWHAEHWATQLQHTASLLKEGQHEEALPKLKKLLRRMVEVLGPGDEAPHLLAIPLIQRALAEAGTGDYASALWHWQMAQTIIPKAAEADLSMFGDEGSFLKSNLLNDPRLESCPRADKETSPPTITKRVAPHYPEGARAFRSSGIIIIYVTVGVDGIPRQARIVKPLETTLDYSALEALRSWRFAPATRAGVPVEAGYCLTVQYELR